MMSKLIVTGYIDGESYRFQVIKCDRKHVHVCTKNGRLCDFPDSVPSHCKIVGKDLQDAQIEKVTA
jgi:hypothetical protein